MSNWTPELRGGHDDRPEGGAAAVALAVCGSGGRARVLADHACDARVLTVGFANLPVAIARRRPALVVAPAMASEFDALDVARALAGTGFDGRFVVVGSDLPCTEVVRHEIAEACPDLALEVLSPAAAPAGMLRSV